MNIRKIEDEELAQAMVKWGNIMFTLTTKYPLSYEFSHIKIDTPKGMNIQPLYSGLSDFAHGWKWRKEHEG